MSATVPAFAQTQSYTYTSASIEINGHATFHPDKFVANGTTYMPIWYVMQTLNQVGYKSAWNGHVWAVTSPQSTSFHLNAQTGHTSIEVNGQIAEVDVPTIAAKDPLSGVFTTFMPIWYVQQLLNNVGITTDTWNGTTWTIGTASGASTKTSTTTSTPPTTSTTGSTTVTQEVMATDMWQTFAGVNWDINSHPSIAAVGITPSATTPVTAGDVATYLADWASKAKGVYASWEPGKVFATGQGPWMPYNLQYEASSDPYTWANINGLFQGTDVSSASSIISQTDVDTILSNLQWWLTGDKVVNGVSYLHVPFYSNYGAWLTETGGKGVGNGISENNYQSYLADETRYYDQITAKVVGTTIDLTLPNTANSASNMAWDVVDGVWEYGGWQSKDNRGGKTIQVPNGGPGLSIDTATLNPDMYLEGFQIALKNVNGAPMFTQPYDVGMLQYPSN